MPARRPHTATQHRPTLPAGVAAGLAWTEAGGDVLYVEASALPRSRGLVLTGHLGDVIKESATAAVTYVRARSLVLGLDPDFYEHVDFHLHFPSGGTPKDGPSAGVAVATQG